jgi:hypothetical protein
MYVCMYVCSGAGIFHRQCDGHGVRRVERAAVEPQLQRHVEAHAAMRLHTVHWYPIPCTYSTYTYIHHASIIYVTIIHLLYNRVQTIQHFQHFIGPVPLWTFIQ